MDETQPQRDPLITASPVSSDPSKSKGGNDDSSITMPQQDAGAPESHVNVSKEMPNGPGDLPRIQDPVRTVRYRGDTDPAALQQDDPGRNDKQDKPTVNRQPHSCAECKYICHLVFSKS